MADQIQWATDLLRPIWILLTADVLASKVMHLDATGLPVRWCETYRPTEPPSSALGKAIGYLLNHRVALTRFLDDGILPIDNGIVERLHRRPAITRRNFLFAGSHAGAERAAIAYSILASCELLDIDPVAYLADILPRLARGVDESDLPSMTPAAWARARTTPAPSPASVQ